jgi:hypothetical protein
MFYFEIFLTIPKNEVGGGGEGTMVWEIST